MELPPLRIGCVKYLNARPFVHGWSGPIVFDHPSALCRRLGVGELDVALVSGFEYLRNPSYTLIDGLAIGSDGPVHSVFVAHQGEPADLREISLDPASQTSVNLLRCLLEEHNLTPQLIERIETNEKSITANRGSLMIGDHAIRFRQQQGERLEYWDLGEAWRKLTELPFVYALWLVRPGVPNAEAIADRLRQQLQQNLAALDRLIAAQHEFSPEFAEHYYRNCIRFTLGAREKEGLTAFQKLCEKHRILPPREPKLRLI